MSPSMGGITKGLGVVVCALALLAAAATPAGAAQTVIVADSFGDGTAGSASATSDKLRLTNDAGQSGSYTTLNRTLDPTKSFRARFRLKITPPPSFADYLSDGMTFVLRSEGSTNLGDGGGGLGYQGISPSVAVEFDTFGGSNDPLGGQHVAFLTSGHVGNHANAVLVPGGLSGRPKNVWIDYDAPKARFALYLSKSEKKPKKPITKSRFPLPLALGSDDVFVGFTGGTGEGFSTQEVTRLKVTQKLPPTEIKYPDFSSTKGLQLNKAADVVEDALRLTPDKGSKKGSVFTKAAFLPTNRSFRSQFSFEIETAGDPQDAADGLAFVLQPGKATTIGGGTSEIGYAGIKPSLGVAFTTYQADDPAGEVGIWSNGKRETSGTPLPIDVVGGSRYGWVDYDAQDNSLDVYYSDSRFKPADPVVSGVRDLTELGRKVRVGFTAATGGFSASHDITSLAVESGLDG